MIRQASEELYALVAPVVEGLGYELLGIDQGRRGRRVVLTVYIDHPDGIGLDDCERVSEQISGVLDVADPIPGSYLLEVSSPGLDRPLFRREHFERHAGAWVRVRLAGDAGGRRNYTGLLRGVEGEEVVLEVDGAEVRLALAAIERARLVPQL
ncbi:ribosome maturation factor RimP [Inmirania thermothiophila]|uniref:Ribosome maturation factor RimP n=1 Tax=Inmirania thermothiophila TaxID=1750597 RepID=A0A3N1XZU2_9GAMM|nr:ribosome maturation factor RimP [Inmirania thermothiophila]ROR32090.1 ribosome maturation factor RimP [Inmirania thermothiophila]